MCNCLLHPASVLVTAQNVYIIFWFDNTQVTLRFILPAGRLLCVQVSRLVNLAFFTDHSELGDWNWRITWQLLIWRILHY